MKSKTGSVRGTSHLTQGSVFDDLGFSPSEALEIKVKAEIYRELLRYIGERRFTQQELGALLGIHQPDVSNLLNGRISKFSVNKLIKFAGKLNLGAEVKLIKPPAGKAAELRTFGALRGSRKQVAVST
jgi:predicted XRE-type DNA-binding protein